MQRVTTYGLRLILIGGKWVLIVMELILLIINYTP